MRTQVISAAPLFLLTEPAFGQSETPLVAPSITASELSERRASGAAPVVIDVRTSEEYASGHIPGALNIPFDQVAQRIFEIEARHGVALYCMVGPRARKGESLTQGTPQSSIWRAGSPRGKRRASRWSVINN